MHLAHLSFCYYFTSFLNDRLAVLRHASIRSLQKTNTFCNGGEAALLPPGFQVLEILQAHLGSALRVQHPKYELRSEPLFPILWQKISLLQSSCELKLG